ncbi:unnamed protein product [Rhizoctonia solani]|uniref:Acetyl-CoA synthetase-like protein n=1 Tax=Rhizoctonia solani TaxID=456999 RepID=A0A8H3C9H4_9AGAM|nr:unnamed protein product [Rhizoctonia solani]
MVVLLPDFVFPPTDGSLPPALAIEFHHEHNPRHVFALLHHATSSLQTTITYGQLACAVHRVANILNPGNAIPQGSNIGLLVSTSSLEYVIMILGAMRAGLVPFPISPRVHPSGIAHLLATTKTSLLIAGGSDAISNVTDQLSLALHESNFSTKLIELATLGNILPLTEFPDALLQPFPSLKPMNNNWTVSILHSSGSTGIPKAIKYHLGGVFKNIINQPIGWTVSGPSARVGTMALPTFHCMGLILQVLAPLYMGYTQVLFAPARVPVMPNQNLTLEAVANTNCSFLICVPTFLDAWAQNDEAIAILKRMKGIMFGGGPLTDAVGDKLAKHEIRIYPLYGATEIGLVNVAPPNDQIRDWPWNCIKVSPHTKPHFIPQNDQDNTFELVFEIGEDHHPFVLNSEFNGKAIYRTRDLLVPYPSRPDVWKFVGRVDDRIVLLNGEKTNPGSMEAEIAKCPLVHSVIMFGQARNQTGVLIELRETPGLLSQKNNYSKELVQILRPYIQRANQTCATHSRLDERAIVFVDPAQPLPRTPKGTIPRSAALKLYVREIEEMYAALEKSLDEDISDYVQPPATWSDPGTVSAWIVERIEGFLGRKVDPTIDLFQQGVDRLVLYLTFGGDSYTGGLDSLIATMLVRTLKAATRASKEPNVQSCALILPQTAVFDHPTVRQLAFFVVRSILGPNTLDNNTQTALERINLLTQKYDLQWPRASTNLPIRRQYMVGEHVVVTGTTGGLGSHLLAQLLANDRVERVWALNRKSSEDTRHRQQVSFKAKMLDAELLARRKLTFVDVVLEDAKLGLDHDLYDEVCNPSFNVQYGVLMQNNGQIRSTATIIIHNAWQVNFNLALQSFEPNIRGTRNLLDLAFSSTAPTGLPRFAFASSISVAGFSGLGRQLDETSVQPEDAASSIGYGQSKLVAEKLLESARQAGLQTCIVRLGQLTGDVNSGSWNTTDWVPSIIASSISVGCLPAAAGTVSWLPLDVAACSIIDACTTDERIPPVIHASHPRPVPWADVMSAFSAVLASRTGSALPVVEFAEWNKRVNS